MSAGNLRAEQASEATRTAARSAACAVTRHMPLDCNLLQGRAEVAAILPWGEDHAVDKKRETWGDAPDASAGKHALDSGPGAAWQAGWRGLTNVKPLYLLFLGSSCTQRSRSPFAFRAATQIFFLF